MVFKTEQESLHFGENYTIKNLFHKNRRPVDINDVDIKMIALSVKKSYDKKDSFKYFIGYRHSQCFSSTVMSKTSSNQWIL